MSNRALWAARAASVVGSCLLLRLLGAPWVLAAVFAVVLLAVSVVRATGSDRRGKEKRGVALDAPGRARRTLTLALAPGQALEVVGKAIEQREDVSRRSVRVDPSALSLSARTSPHFDGRFLFFGERVHVSITGIDGASQIELTSHSIVPARTDAGMNEANVEALSKAVWQQASESSAPTD